jgi:hypothetical protein
MDKGGVCWLFDVGYIHVKKGYLIVEELGTQITQKTFRRQVVSAVSRQPETVFEHESQ